MAKKISLLFICFLFMITTVAQAKTKKLSIDAKAAVAIDGKSGVILYAKNAHEIVPMASTTKIVTSLVALNRGNVDEKFKISKSSASINGSTVGYREGEEIALRELLYGLMYKSGNDAAIAIAEGIGGTKENFYKQMNECSRNIGLINSSFNSPHGLDTENHYSTAYDLAIATKKAMENDIFREIVGTREISRGKYNFTRDYNNINKMLFQVPEANGVKTGYTGGAGKCLVSSFRYQDRDIITVVLNCPERWRESAKLFEYVKENYSDYSVNVHDYFKDKNSKFLDLVKDDKISIMAPKDGIESEMVLITPTKKIMKDDYLGYISIKSKVGDEIYKKNIYSEVSMKNKEFLELMN